MRSLDNRLLLEDDGRRYVNEDQQLPKHICISCLETVEAFDKFYVNVAQNQSFLVQNEGATVGILVRNDEYVENDNDMTCEEVVLGKPVELHGSYMLHCAAKEDPPSNPPSYDEVQQNKRAQLISSVATIQPVGKTLAEDHCCIEKTTVEPEPNDGEESKTLPEDVVIEEEANDDEDNVSEWEIDGNGTIAPTDDEAGFLVRVSKFKYPRMIRDGKLIVRGEELDKCLEQFYGLTCDVCKETRSTIETLSEHYRKVHHVEGGYVVCCGRKIEKRLLMAMHMAKHLEPEAFECPVCKKMMTSPRILRFHIKNHLPEEERPLKCDLCPRRFSYVSGLLTHASTHRTENKSNQAYHICDTCGRAYRTRSRLMDHILASHTGPSQCVRCETCGKQFSSKSNLNYHMTTHEPNLHQEQCEHCGKWLKNKICLRKHMQQHSDLRYQCSCCDYSTTNGQSMQSHLRVQHSDEKPHVCPECGKAFKLRCNLRSHMPQHTGERNFKCEFCSRQFVSNSNYYSHRKRIHFEEMELKKRQKELKERETRIKLKKQ
uniref:C2H2-type domain-containing protein n=1 Tax=Anopheles atroparvus TaxID=41427 RepID=A0A182JFW9_ANOAO